MPDTTYTDPVFLQGDMIASLTSAPSQQGNPGDANFGMVLPGVAALGDGADQYRLVWHTNLNGSDTEFGNGQTWRLEVYDAADDPDDDPSTGDTGWSTVSGYDTLTPRSELISNLGAGDEYVVFSVGGTSDYLLYDINGGLPTSPTTLTYLGVDEMGDTGLGDNDGGLDFYDAVVCFAAGVQIDTPGGARPVETLRPGDLVTTRGGAARPVLWRSSRPITARQLATSPGLRPVRIHAGALGPGQPTRDLLVSPQHRIVVSSTIAAGVAGSPAVLVPAIKLTALRGISQVCPRRGVSYHHFLLDRHDIVRANGAETESFYPGREALATITAEDKAALFSVLPELARPIPGMRLRPALPICDGQTARHLALRHRKNRRALVLS